MATLAELKAEAARRGLDAGQPDRLSQLKAEAQKRGIDTQPSQPIMAGRRGRRSQRQSNTESLLQRIEAGELSAQDLSDEEFGRVERLRMSQVPEISQAGIKSVAPEAGLGTAMLGLTTFDPQEFAQILKAQYPNIGIQSQPNGEIFAFNPETQQRVSLNRPGLSPMDVLQGLGVMSAFAGPAAAASAAPQAASRLIGQKVAAPTALRALAQTGAAMSTEAGIQKTQELAGGEFDPEDVALAGAAGLVGELVAPTGRAIAGKFRQGQETAEQAARRQLFEQEGLVPTRAQVTRDAGEFQTQQSLIKRQPDSPVQARLEQQEALLSGAFEKRAVDSGGNVITSTSTAIDEVLERSIALDENISNLYQKARELAPGVKDIRLNKLAGTLKTMAGEERVSGGLYSAVRDNLRQRGVLDKNGKIVGRIDVETSEAIRQDINSLFDSLSDRGKQLSRTLKDSLDEDVLKARGDDIFSEARAAKRDFERGLERAGLSKFDKRRKNIVRDMLENKISPDTFVNDVVFAKGVRQEDLNQLKVYLNQTDKGKQAWNDLRAQAIEAIREKSFKGPVREDGVTRSLSRDALERTLKSIDKKSMVLFTAEERMFLNRMKEIAKLREPPPGRAIGGGPTEVAVNQAKSRFPIVGALLDDLSDWRKNKLLLRLPKRTKSRGTRPTGRASLSPTAQTLRTDEEK
jgi:hypothetical protein